MFDRNRKPQPSQYAALVVFRPGTTREEVAAALAAIADKVERRDVQKFDPDFGGPVLYFP